MKIKFLLLSIIGLSFICIAACTQNVEPSNEEYNEIFKPDSLLTAEQIDLKFRIADIIIGSIIVKGDKIATTLKKSDFTQKDIPVYYYKMLLKNIDDINKSISEDNISLDNAKKQIEQASEEYKKNRKQEK